MTVAHAHARAHARAHAPGADAGDAPSARAADAARAARVVRSLAHATLLEAWRSRWPAAALLAAATIAGLTAFAGAIALAEPGAVAIALGAPLARVAAVLVLATFAASALSRELADGSIDLVLAAPISRLGWILGRWTGLAAVAAGTALAVSAPLAAHAPPLALAAWAASLWMELCIVGGLVLLLSISFAQVPATLLSLLAFYAASRLIGVFLLLAERAPIEGPRLVARLGDAVLAVLAHLLPRLDLFARTEWLLDAGSARPGPAVLQTLGWVAIVPAAAWIDFGRRRG